MQFNCYKNYALILVLLLLFACKTNKKTPENHREYLVPFIDKAEHITNIDEACDYVDSALATIKTPGYEDQYLVYFFKERRYLAMASKGEKKKNLSKALRYTDSMTYATSQDTMQPYYLAQMAQCHLSKGDVLFEMKKYSLAYQNYFTAKSLSKRTPTSRVRINYRLATINYISKRYRQAALLYIEACNDEIHGEDDFMVFSNTQTFLDNAGLSYANANMLDSAKLYYNKALRYISENEAKFKNESGFIQCAKGIIYGNLAKERRGKHLRKFEWKL